MPVLDPRGYLSSTTVRPIISPTKVHLAALKHGIEHLDAQVLRRHSCCLEAQHCAKPHRVLGQQVATAGGAMRTKLVGHIGPDCGPVDRALHRFVHARCVSPDAADVNAASERQGLHAAVWRGIPRCAGSALNRAARRLVAAQGHAVRADVARAADGEPAIRPTI
jgi:hypothetical protein